MEALPVGALTAEVWASLRIVVIARSFNAYCVAAYAVNDICQNSPGVPMAYPVKLIRYKALYQIILLKKSANCAEKLLGKECSA
jgi:hypothetical protein